jgi:hypothetical protein
MAEGKKGKTEKTKRWPPEDTRQHMKAARSEIRDSYKSLFPPKFVEHRRAARREMLLALRSLVDHALERIEAKEGT